MIYRLANLVPSITSSNFIPPNTTLIGDIVLSEDVSFWFNVVIRAEMTTVKIGENITSFNKYIGDFYMLRSIK